MQKLKVEGQLSDYTCSSLSFYVVARRCGTRLRLDLRCHWQGVRGYRGWALLTRIAKKSGRLVPNSWQTVIRLLRLVSAKSSPLPQKALRYVQ